MSEDRKEGPLNYRMSGDYIVISPIPQNMVLRYESAWRCCGRRGASLPAPVGSDDVPRPNIAQRMAHRHPARSGTSRRPAPAGAVKVANVTALYSDKLTDGRE